MSIKMSEDDVGRFVRVFYNDLGARDGIFVAYDEDDTNHKVLFLGESTVSTTNGAPIIKVGEWPTAEYSGLD